MCSARAVENSHIELDDTIVPFDFTDLDAPPAPANRSGARRAPEADDEDSHILGMMVNTVLQMLSLERATCVVHLETVANRGQIVLTNGAMVDARTGLITGDEAARQMMR